MSATILISIGKLVAGKALKGKIIKDTIDLITKKDVSKLDVVLSYIPGAGGKASRWFSRYNKQTKKFLDKKALAVANMSKLKKGTKAYQRQLRNIEIAQLARDKWVKNEIKKVVKSKTLNRVPGRRLLLTSKDFAKAINNKDSWWKICKKGANVMSATGNRSLSSLFAKIDKFGSMSLTVNQWWKQVSDNHSATYPLMGSKGGAKMRYVMQLKDKYRDEFIDREFYFIVNSPQTGNFNQWVHSYDPNIKEYTLPIRGWGGTKIQEYHLYDKVDLQIIITLLTNLKTDYGVAEWNKFRGADSYNRKDRNKN